MSSDLLDHKAQNSRQLLKHLLVFSTFLLQLSVMIYKWMFAGNIMKPSHDFLPFKFLVYESRFQKWGQSLIYSPVILVFILSVYNIVIQFKITWSRKWHLYPSDLQCNKGTQRVVNKRKFYSWGRICFVWQPQDLFILNTVMIECFVSLNIMWRLLSIYIELRHLACLKY